MAKSSRDQQAEDERQILIELQKKSNENIDVIIVATENTAWSGA